MDRFQKIIKIAQKFLYCPKCKRKYDISEIKLRGWFDDIFILQTQCANGHKPIIMNVIISTKPIDKDIINIVNKKTDAKKIENKNKLFAQAIDNFNGDFESLWKK